MFEVLVWLLAVEILGLLTVPVLYLALPWLPDRGYSIAKPVSLLLIFYAVWIFGSTSFIPNSAVTIVAVVLGLAACSYWILRRHGQHFRVFLRRQFVFLMFTEILFLGVFAFWAVFIAQDGALTHTEQPMDFAFLNATVVSDRFPPNDPWLSGETISYYYFGYLIFGGMSKLTLVPTAVAYNLSLATIAGMAGVGILGFIFNLVRLVGGRTKLALFSGLMGVVLLLFASNLSGGLELLRAGGLESESFWEWVDIKGFDGPMQSESWYPDEDGWWWWKATRIIDTVEEGVSKDYTITEFPYFSFLLGDLHPHVMGLPFVMAFLVLLLGFFISPVAQGFRWIRDNWILAILIAVTLGGLGFINLWDLPVFGVLLIGAAVVKGLSSRQQGWVKSLEPAVVTGFVLVMAIFLYIPFFLSFDSQADGILPVGEFVSRPLHFILVWGLFLFVAVSFLCVEFGLLVARRPRWFALLIPSIVIALTPWFIWALVQVVVLWSVTEAIDSAMGRLMHIFPLVSMAVVAVYIILKRSFLASSGTGDAEIDQSLPEATCWTESGGLRDQVSRGVTNPEIRRLAGIAPVILMATAIFLLMGQELFRVADLFGNRMNTVFKLSYQVWILLAAVSGYAIFYVLEKLQQQRSLVRPMGYVWIGILAVGITVSLYYPLSTVITKSLSSNVGVTLNGLAHVSRSNSAEYNAILWLTENASSNDVLVEAVGDDYSEFGRISASTGIPTILGWTFHEEQWRGSRTPFEGRREDVESLYRTVDYDQARAILDQYEVTYIYIGPRERGSYGLEGNIKFEELALEVFAEGNVVIYRVRG